MLHKLRFYGSIAIVYVLTFGAIGVLLYSSHLFGTKADATQGNDTASSKPVSPRHAIAGTPARIAIPSYDIDLPVDTGRYDHNRKKWTLSDTHAHYAAITAPANNRAGTTFIYGHGTNAVFGKIGANPPPAGTIAHIYTDNGHLFTYTLQSIADYTPGQTDIFENALTGSPQLIIQTCTGAFSEWRTMFTFSFKEIE